MEENTTVMRASAEDLLGGGGASVNRCVTVTSYLEALGVMAAHKAGVNPTCLTDSIPGVRPMSTTTAVATGVKEGLLQHARHA